jgi:hypothetical protein
MKRLDSSQAWWFTPVIPALRRLRQEDHEFEASLDYIIRPYLKKKKKDLIQFMDFIENSSIIRVSEMEENQ